MYIRNAFLIKKDKSCDLITAFIFSVFLSIVMLFEFLTAF